MTKSYLKIITSMISIGLIAICSAQTITEIQDLANNNDPKAQYTLGKEYFSGTVIHEDKEEAFSWFKKSAEQGYDSAQFALGNLYYLGAGTKKDKQKALFWYTKSGEQGNGEAQFIIGRMHYKGIGTLIDRKKSAYWIRLAFENGSGKAQKFWNKRKLWQYEYQ